MPYKAKDSKKKNAIKGALTRMLSRSISVQIPKVDNHWKYQKTSLKSEILGTTLSESADLRAHWAWAPLFYHFRKFELWDFAEMIIKRPIEVLRRVFSASSRIGTMILYAHYCAIKIALEEKQHFTSLLAGCQA